MSDSFTYENDDSVFDYYTDPEAASINWSVMGDSQIAICSDTNSTTTGDVFRPTSAAADVDAVAKDHPAVASSSNAANNGDHNTNDVEVQATWSESSIDSSVVPMSVNSIMNRLSMFGPASNKPGTTMNGPRSVHTESSTSNRDRSDNTDPLPDSVMFYQPTEWKGGRIIKQALLNKRNILILLGIGLAIILTVTSVVTVKDGTKDDSTREEPSNVGQTPELTAADDISLSPSLAPTTAQQNSSGPIELEDTQNATASSSELTMEPTHGPTSEELETDQSQEEDPTDSLTQSRTMLPTQSPTMMPTKMPTDKRTMAPVVEKDVDSAPGPTFKPTFPPTAPPTSRAFAPSFGPTAFPTKAPTPRPTTQPTEFPTETPWDTAKCGRDSPVVSFWVNNAVGFRGCAWLRQPEQVEARRRLCQQGNDAFAYCRETCRNCTPGNQPPQVLTPSTATPTEPLILTPERDTPLPTLAPVMPVAAPTSTPTMLILPGQVTVPTSAPTVLTVPVTSKPVQPHTRAPTRAPKRRPTPQPTRSPTLRPTPRPTRLEDTCEDDKKAEFYVNAAEGYQNCKWLDKRDGSDYRDELCRPGGAAHAVCDQTCRGCGPVVEAPASSASSSDEWDVDRCGDDVTNIRVWIDEEERFRHCSWLAEPEHADIRREECQRDNDGWQLCRRTCGNCT